MPTGSYQFLALVQGGKFWPANNKILLPGKHKLHRFEAGLRGAACFKIFQVILKSNLASFKRQFRTESLARVSERYPVVRRLYVLRKFGLACCFLL